MLRLGLRGRVSSRLSRRVYRGIGHTRMVVMPPDTSLTPPSAPGPSSATSAGTSAEANSGVNAGVRVIDLGPMGYAQAYKVQLDHHAEVLAAREAGQASPGVLLLVEHDPPVITMTKRPEAKGHLIANAEALRLAGVEVVETDRGGDITFHGPGQLVVYPILDLNVYSLGLHDYMRLLESAVIDTVGTFGVTGQREPGATGVWVPQSPQLPASKICAMGVRVRRWVSFHGLALNVTTNLDHFGLIVPCGLTGRKVTSLQRELGARCPSMIDVKRALIRSIDSALCARRSPTH